MATLKIKRTDRFEGDLKKLSRTRPGLKDAVNDTLAQIASGVSDLGNRIPRMGGGRLVFRKRVKYGNLSKRDGARIIYNVRDQCLWALFIHLKGDRSSIPVKEIKQALNQHGM